MQTALQLLFSLTNRLRNDITKIFVVSVDYVVDYVVSTISVPFFTKLKIQKVLFRKDSPGKFFETIKHLFLCFILHGVSYFFSPAYISIKHNYSISCSKRLLIVSRVHIYHLYTRSEGDSVKYFLK